MRTVSTALAWAKKQVDDHTSGWKGWCQRFTRETWGLPSRDGRAIWAWERAQYRHPKDRNPPAGAAGYGDIGKFGHAWIFTGNGEGIISTDIFGSGYVYFAHLSDLEKRWGVRYLGWTQDLNGYLLPLRVNDGHKGTEVKPSNPVKNKPLPTHDSVATVGDNIGKDDSIDARAINTAIANKPISGTWWQDVLQVCAVGYVKGWVPKNTYEAIRDKHRVDYVWYAVECIQRANGIKPARNFGPQTAMIFQRFHYEVKNVHN